MPNRTELEKKNVTRMSNADSNKLTRECLRLALRTLMNEKEYDKISISELVTKAGVSRPSFYRNYNSKEDLIIELEADIVSEYVHTFLSEKYQQNLYLWFYDNFVHIKDHRDVLMLILNANMDGIIFANAPDIIASHLKVDSELEKYRLIALFGGLKEIVIVWAHKGMVETPEEMATLCDKIFSPIIAEYKDILQ